MNRIHRFTVTGSGEFPFDMLRYDRCWPASSQDAVQLTGDHASDRRSVDVEGLEAPTRARWESFAWPVIEVSR